MEQLDRIESELRLMRDEVHAVKANTQVLVDRIANVEKKASFWGAISGAVVALTTSLAGCL